MSFDNERDGEMQRNIESNRLISEFNLITDENKTAYMRLSVFPCEFNKDAFEAVCLAPYQRLEEWAKEESGLVEIVAFEKAGRFRYRLPESARTWTAKGLENAGETLENQLRFARHFAYSLQENKGAERTEAIDLNLELKNLICSAKILLATQKRNFPEIWHLGLALAKIESKDRESCLLLTIECFEASLKAISKNISPQNWGIIQNNIAFCYMNLRSGERDKNIREAISRYEDAANSYSERGFPKRWSDTQFSLGVAYKELPLGDSNTNLRNAIRCFLAALKARTLTDHPQDDGATQMSLGGAYLALEGEEEANYRNAILCFEAVLTGYPKSDFPQNWAIARHNLGVAYSCLQKVDSSGHFEKALEHFRLALEIRKKDRFPEAWAQTQFCLGNAYREVSNQRWGTHLQDAIKYYQEALSVFNKIDSPSNWGEVQNNLGVSFLALTTGERTANLKVAMDCFVGALRVVNREENPSVWALRQGNLGLALSALGRKREALEIFEDAREVYRKIESDPGVLRIDRSIKLALSREEGKQSPASKRGSQFKNEVCKILDYAFGAVAALFEWV